MYEGLDIEIFSKKELVRSKLNELLKAMPRGSNSFDFYFEPHKAYRLGIHEHLGYMNTPLQVGLSLLDKKKYFRALAVIDVNYPTHNVFGNYHVYVAPKLSSAALRLHPELGPEFRDYHMDDSSLLMAMTHNDTQGKTSKFFNSCVRKLVNILDDNEEFSVVIDDCQGTKNVMSLYEFKRNLSSLQQKWKKSEKKYK